jgi:hypothetical protein
MLAGPKQLQASTTTDETNARMGGGYRTTAGDLPTSIIKEHRLLHTGTGYGISLPIQTTSPHLTRKRVFRVNVDDERSSLPTRPPNMSCNH